MTRFHWSAAGGRHGLRRLILACCASLPVLAGGTAFAHGVPASLDIWGDFGLSIARCQRVIGRGGAACGLTAWRVRRTCALAPLAGQSCDTTAADAAIETARTAAVDAITPVCTDQQVKSLQFLGVYEAQNDVVRYCRELEAATTSAVFDPLPSDLTALSPAERVCIAATTAATSKLLTLGFRDRERLLNRIAVGRFSPMQKRSMVAQSTQRIGAATTALADLLLQTCPADVFAGLYATTPASFLALVASRADCLGGATYAQGGILCPASVCGNGMKESGEECDDHNLVDGDGCSAECTRE